MCHHRTVLVKLFFLIGILTALNPLPSDATADQPPPNMADLPFLMKCQGLLAHAAIAGTLSYRMGNIADVFFPSRTSRQFIVTSSLQRTYPSLTDLMPFLSSFNLERDAVEGNKQFNFSGRWQPSPTDMFLFSIPPPHPENPGPARLIFYYYFTTFGLNTIAIDDYVDLIQRWVNAESKTQTLGTRGDAEFMEYRFSGNRSIESDIRMKRLRSIYGNYSVSVEIEDTDIRRVVLTFQSLIRFLIGNSELQVSQTLRDRL